MAELLRLEDLTVEFPLESGSLRAVDHFAEVTRGMEVDVELLNHPLMDDLFVKLARLRTRTPGEPHPLAVGEATYQRFLGVISACARAQIARRGRA